MSVIFSIFIFGYGTGEISKIVYLTELQSKVDRHVFLDHRVFYKWAVHDSKIAIISVCYIILLGCVTFDASVVNRER